MNTVLKSTMFPNPIPQNTHDIVDSRASNINFSQAQTQSNVIDPTPPSVHEQLAIPKQFQEDIIDTSI